MSTTNQGTPLRVVLHALSVEGVIRNRSMVTRGGALIVTVSIQLERTNAVIPVVGSMCSLKNTVSTTSQLVTKRELSRRSKNVWAIQKKKSFEPIEQ